MAVIKKRRAKTLAKTTKSSSTASRRRKSTSSTRPKTLGKVTTETTAVSEATATTVAEPCRNALTEYQAEVAASAALQRTVGLTNLVPYLESLGVMPSNEDDALPETKLILWAAADRIGSLSQGLPIHEAFSVIADALGRSHDQLVERFKSGRKKLTNDQMEHLDNVRHAENQFLELHQTYPAFRPWLYLRPARLRRLSLEKRGELTDIIEISRLNVSRPAYRHRLCRLDRRGLLVPIVWEELGYNLEDSGTIEGTLSGPRPGPDDIGPRSLGVLKRAVNDLNELRNRDVEAMKRPCWPEPSIESARLKLTGIVAELETAVLVASIESGKKLAEHKTVRAHDNEKNGEKKLPMNSDIRDLCLYLKAKRIAFGSHIECVRDFCRVNKIKDKKPEDLLRQAQRFPGLWK